MRPTGKLHRQLLLINLFEKAHWPSNIIDFATMRCYAKSTWPKRLHSPAFGFSFELCIRNRQRCGAVRWWPLRRVVVLGRVAISSGGNVSVRNHDTEQGRDEGPNLAEKRFGATNERTQNDRGTSTWASKRGRTCIMTLRFTPLGSQGTFRKIIEGVRWRRDVGLVWFPSMALVSCCLCYC